MHPHVAKTSLRAIAAEAGVALATMQYAFPSKQELLRAVIEDVAEEISQVLAAAGATDQGIDHAVRQGLWTFWTQLVAGGRILQHVCNPDEARSLDRLAGLADMVLLLAEVRPASKA